MPATIDKLTAADIGFLVAGSPSGPGVPPLVCLHGIGGDATNFMPQLHGLSGRRRTLSWNMPGYGPSAPMAEMSFASLCDRLCAALDALGIDRVVIAGAPDLDAHLSLQPFQHHQQTIAQGRQVVRACARGWDRQLLGHVAELGHLRKPHHPARTLEGVELPPHDVHGRPTMVQLPKDELERRFGRSSSPHPGNRWTHRCWQDEALEAPYH